MPESRLFGYIALLTACFLSGVFGVFVALKLTPPLTEGLTNGMTTLARRAIAEAADIVQVKNKEKRELSKASLERNEKPIYTHPKWAIQPAEDRSIQVYRLADGPVSCYIVVSLADRGSSPTIACLGYPTTW